MSTALRNWIPSAWRRRLQVMLVNANIPLRLARAPGPEGIRQRGHRRYVSTNWEAGRLQFDLLKAQGLQPSDVLYDIACGSLRGGQYFIPYLEKGHYCGLEGEPMLVNAGIAHELPDGLIEQKKPEFVYGFDFPFDQFSKPPTYAIAMSLFSHLNEQDICTCLRRLAARVETRCSFYFSYYESRKLAVNFKRSHPALAFFYTRQQMMDFGREEGGWQGRFLGNCSLPAGQVVMEFTLTK